MDVCNNLEGLSLAGISKSLPQMEHLKGVALGLALLANIRQAGKACQGQTL
jgi:hypothetical protein